MYTYRIPKYKMTLATYTQAENMVVEHATRALLKGNIHYYEVVIERYSEKAKRYQPYLNVQAFRLRDGGINVFSKKFNITMSKAQAEKFLMDH